MATATDRRPHAIIIEDWAGFCRLLDRTASEQAKPDAPILKAQAQWQDLEPAPAPAFLELLIRGAGFNVLRHSPALEQWLSEWGIAFALHHPSAPEGLGAVPRKWLQKAA